MNLFPCPVHVSSTFESGAMLHDCLSVDPQVQSSTLPFFFEAPWMSLPSAVHVSSTFEFGAMLHDCLSVDPQVQSSILQSFPSSRADPLDWENWSLFIFPIGSFPKCVYVYIIYLLFLLLFVFCFVLCRKKRSRDENYHGLITERARRTKSVSYLCFPLISDKR